MKTHLAIAAAATLTAAVAAYAATGAAPRAALDPAHPVVVELFQSQGCSSCPPANANVNALADKPGVLALSFAVTYWDQLGWKDKFATKANTQRQWDYAKALGHDQVWTPQVIVNGSRDTVGRNPADIDRLIAAAARPKDAPAVTLSPASVAIAAGVAPRGGADVWLVRYDPRTVEVAIRAGENNGKTLPHKNIVRELTRLGTWTGPAVRFPVPAEAPGLATAVLVQGAHGGPILASAVGQSRIAVDARS